MFDLEKRYEGVKQKLGKLEEEKAETRANKEAVPSQITAPLDLAVIMHTRQDVYKFMSVLPKPIDRLRQPKLDPVGLSSMDLKSYIAADPQLKEVASNLLCLPGRISWCSSDHVHGIALGPMHLFNGTEYTTWTEGSEFIPLYGRTFHLFYTTRRGLVFYAGLYKAIDIRTQCPEGISAQQIDHIFWPALAEALTSGSDLTKSLKNVLSDLYHKGALRVEPLGLQCVKFDLDIYTILKNRFSVFQSAMKSVGKREANFPEASMPGNLPISKKKKIH
ncbi:hypothetical protein HYPSUDRAFT_764799 [Hypholoma sublateritium FD-334 SS-4]|uniref:Uncharacterized protein n=1 Tax=Hypholoma sublateritium (strain FD-334 SS-4) TaxID=945553 RepID=A0A0D2MC36_HYPSF|nr:hypothetical protein HYPSUDRAFT_764799 [Hypholoma sublateritium FD-334 SS-4]